MAKMEPRGLKRSQQEAGRVNGPSKKAKHLNSNDFKAKASQPAKSVRGGDAISSSVEKIRSDLPPALLNSIGDFLEQNGFHQTNQAFASERKVVAKSTEADPLSSHKPSTSTPSLLLIFEEFSNQLQQVTSKEESDQSAAVRSDSSAESSSEEESAEEDESSGSESDGDSAKSDDDSVKSAGSLAPVSASVPAIQKPIDESAVNSIEPKKSKPEAGSESESDPESGSSAESEDSSSEEEGTHSGVQADSSSSETSDSDADSESEVASSESEASPPTQKVTTEAKALAVKAASVPLPQSEPEDSEESGESDSDSDSDVDSDSSEDDEEVEKSKEAIFKKPELIKLTAPPPSDSSHTLKGSTSPPKIKAAAYSSSASSSDSSSSDSESDSDSDSDSEPGSGDEKKAATEVSETTTITKTSTLLPIEEDSTGTKRKRTVSPSLPASANVSVEMMSTAATKKFKTLSGKPFKPQNVPFTRVPKDTKVDDRLASNAYVPYDYANNAHRDLSITKGKGFTKEKNKKKRGSYRGGFIDVAGKKGIKFDD